MKKILVVDDQLEIRELVAVTLEVGDFQLFSAATGHEALKISRIEHPDIILLDIKMPGSALNGLDVCRILKNDPVTANIYIIIVSASGQQNDIITGKAAGADDYLIKPFSPSTLMAKIEQAIAAQSLPKQSR